MKATATASRKQEELVRQDHLMCFYIILKTDEASGI